MKTNTIIRKSLSKRRKEYLKRVFKLSSLLWMICVAIISLGILVLSYCLYESNGWLSGVLVSAGCGGITGLVLYFLSNVRNNKIAILQKELSSLKSIYNILNQIIGFERYHKLCRKSWGVKRDILADGYEIIRLLEELSAVVDAMSKELYDTLEIKCDASLSYHNIKLFINRLVDIDDENDVNLWVKDFITQFEEVKATAFELANEKEDQLMFLGRFFI